MGYQNPEPLFGLFLIQQVLEICSHVLESAPLHAEAPLTSIATIYKTTNDRGGRENRETKSESPSPEKKLMVDPVGNGGCRPGCCIILSRATSQRAPKFGGVRTCGGLSVSDQCKSVVLLNNHSYQCHTLAIHY